MQPYAFITGGSRGIGFAVARYLVEQQYNVILIARNAERLEQARQTLQQLNAGVAVKTHAVDLCGGQQVYEQVQQIVRHYSQIDVLFNNAGILTGGSLDMDMADYEKLINTNVTGVFAVAKAVGEKMETQGNGYILNLSSMAGRRGLAHAGGYCSSKFAVSGLSESLFKRYAHEGIKVTAICPSVIDTDMTENFAMANADKIKTADIVNTVDYLLKLSPNATMPYIEVYCTALVE